MSDDTSVADVTRQRLGPERLWLMTYPLCYPKLGPLSSSPRDAASLAIVSSVGTRRSSSSTSRETSSSYYRLVRKYSLICNNVIVCARHVAESLPSVVCWTWYGYSNASKVWASCGATQQSLDVFVTHQVAYVCGIKSTQAAATSSVHLAAGNETCCIALSTMASRIYRTTTWKHSDHVSSVALVRCASAQGLPISYYLHCIVITDFVVCHKYHSTWLLVATWYCVIRCEYMPI